MGETARPYLELWNLRQMRNGILKRVISRADVGSGFGIRAEPRDCIIIAHLSYTPFKCSV